ncbi:MAG: putative TetR family transcriptional regulator [Frondihabitans sp.]|nr:putative TetR family transcriptional regulator [Frondihabitans sp.]
MDGDDTRVDRSFLVKKAILEAAAAAFASKGFVATGVREIAASAGVDPALIIRHFGSKESLFLRTMTVGNAFTDAINGPLDDLGPRMVRFLLGATDPAGIRSVYAALLRASDRPGVQEQLRASLQTAVVTPLVGRLASPDAELRAHLFSAQLNGLMSSLWVTNDPLLTLAPEEQIIELYGASLQNILIPLTAPVPQER